MSGDGDKDAGQDSGSGVEPENTAGAVESEEREGVNVAAELAAGAFKARRGIAQALSPTVSLTAFILGLLAGVPLAIFGLDTLFEAATPIFGFLLIIFIVFAAFAALVVVFRSAIWSRLFRFGQVELERFASPLARAAKYVADRNVGDAAESLREFAEMALSRYTWVATRRWLLATATGFIAAIAALAASALLFQQNELLAVQNERLNDQTAILEMQIQLGEAQRSLSIVPEILDIGALIAEEMSTPSKSGREDYSASDLSASLRSRIIAATNAVRPYRYLTNTLANPNLNQITYNAMVRRPDLADEEVFAAAKENIDFLLGSGNEEGNLIDRPVSPERGQIISILFNNRVLETENLTYFGADFSFAEVRQPTLGLMSFQHAKLRYSDFSTTNISSSDFGGAYLDGARFRGSVVIETSFSSLADADVKPPLEAGISGRDVWPTHMIGADFTGGVIRDSQFEDLDGLAMNFDGAVLHEVSFARSHMSASTFRRTLIGSVKFDGALMRGVDFDGALVYSDTFLDDLANAAVDGSFQRDIYELREATPDEVFAHPHADLEWQLGELGGGQAYIVIRTGDFDLD